MKLINQGAETRLYDKARSLAECPHGSWRCLYFNLAAVDPRASRRHAILGSLHDLLYDIDGTLFQCEDGDMFILFQGAVLPVLRRLGNAIEELRPEHMLQPRADSPFVLFDLGLHWPAFFGLVRQKHMRATASQPASPFAIWNRPASPNQQPAHA